MEFFYNLIKVDKLFRLTLVSSNYENLISIDTFYYLLKYGHRLDTNTWISISFIK